MGLSNLFAKLKRRDISTLTAMCSPTLAEQVEVMMAATSPGPALGAEARETLRALVEEQWPAACLARDWDKVLAMCAQDIVYMPADHPALRGHAEFRAWLHQFPPIVKMDQPLEDAEGRGDLAVVRASFAVAIEAAGKRVNSAGKVLCSFHRQASGKWMVKSVCWNWDQPMTPVS
jgi:ketosteroid isomerase-like protein